MAEKRLGPRSHGAPAENSRQTAYRANHSNTQRQPLATGLSLLHGGWRAIDEMEEGETISGTVLRLPAPNVFNGNRLFLKTQDEVIGLRATARTGHTVLKRELTGLRVRVDDRITITYKGKRPTFDGTREYRLYEVSR